MATIEIKLPDIGEGVNEGELVRWLVKVGDQIKPDQPLAEVMTDKATVEIPSQISGRVVELKFKEGQVIAVGHAMLIVEGQTGASTSVASSATQAPKAAVAPAPAPTGRPTAPAPSQGHSLSVSPSSAGAGAGEIYPPVAESRVLATPATRRLARESGVDINQIHGTGLAGRVTREDVMKNQGVGAVAAGAPSYQPMLQIPKPSYQGPAGMSEERVPLKGVRKKIAEKMQLSKHVIPHFTLMDEANVTALVAMRGELKDKAAKYGVKVTYLPFVMKALIATAREFQGFNASIDDAAQEIVYKKYFNIGFAADTPQGLLVPVVKHADQKSILQISSEIMDLSKKGRDNKLSPDEMKGATMSITNIGSIGGTYATPIINHPEVAILGMYKIQERPIFVNGQVKAAQMMNFTITCDHRLIDGAVAANFLKAFIERIENPGVLMLDLM